MEEWKRAIVGFIGGALIGGILLDSLAAALITGAMGAMITTIIGE